MKKVIVLLIVTISLFSCGGGDQSVSGIIERRNLEEIIRFGHCNFRK